jgi:PAS domain S-box-containing protein
MFLVHLLTLPTLFTTFMPHGSCYLWKPYLVGLHFGSNAVIALSYFSIPFTLIYLICQRKDFPFNGLFFLVAAFIISCGVGHGMDIWTIWYPNYWISGIIRAITAIVSLMTALVFIRLIPHILSLPSPAQLAMEVEERKRAETALKASQKRLQGVFNQTFQLMGLLNPDGTIISLNQTALGCLKNKFEDIKNHKFQDVFNWQSSPEAIDQAIQSSVKNKQGNQEELVLTQSDQTLATFDFSFKPLLDDSGKVELIIAEGRNISQRKEAEEQLQQLNQELEERVQRRTQALEILNQAKQELLNRERMAKTKIKIYEDIVLSIPIGLVIWKLENMDDLNSFRLIDINPMAMDILHLNREEHLNKKMIDCFPSIWSDSHRQAVEMYAKVIRTQTSQRIEDLVYGDYRIGEFHFDIKAFPLANQCLGIAFDNITDRKQIEQALLESTRRYRQVVNSVNEIIFQLDLQGNWTFLNPAWTKMTGYNVIDSLNHPFTDYICDPSQVTEILQLFEALIAGEIEILQKDFSACSSQGDSLWLEMKAELHQIGEDEENKAILGTIVDITTRKKAEIIRKEKARELSHLNTLLLTATAQLEKRNQELDQFAYVTSHDLKAPLRAIANLSQWIEEDLEDHLNEETRHHLTLLRKRVQRMDNLINGLLQYSRIGRLKSKARSLNITRLLREIIDSLDPPSSFTLSIIGKMPTLVTDKISLQQVFSNLISNAIKHHPRSNGIIEISCLEVEKHYQFSVKDDGKGIDPAYHQKIFEIFQTLTPRDQKENTGIGLSIVKKIIENQGGKITLQSQVDQGTTFHFTWPKNT